MARLIGYGAFCAISAGFTTHLVELGAGRNFALLASVRRVEIADKPMGPSQRTLRADVGLHFSVSRHYRVFPGGEREVQGFLRVRVIDLYVILKPTTYPRKTQS